MTARYAMVLVTLGAISCAASASGPPPAPVAAPASASPSVAASASASASAPASASASASASAAPSVSASAAPPASASAPTCAASSLDVFLDLEDGWDAANKVKTLRARLRVGAKSPGLLVFAGHQPAYCRAEVAGEAMQLLCEGIDDESLSGEVRLDAGDLVLVVRTNRGLTNGWGPPPTRVALAPAPCGARAAFHPRSEVRDGKR